MALSFILPDETPEPVKPPIRLSLERNGSDIRLCANDTIVLVVKANLHKIWLNKAQSNLQELGFETQENGAVAIDYY